MPRRSIRDAEIGLIKRMLQRGQRNRDIQFYFNRQDRPVNSGRITGIKNGTYGPDVPIASDEELDEFLARFEPVGVGVVVAADHEPRRSIADQARDRFERRDGDWFLIDGETDDQECKEVFDPRRMEPIIRAIAGLANNRGGFVFVGVGDEEFDVIGLQNNAFREMDIARIVDKTKLLLTPTPMFSKDVIELDGRHIGVISVKKHEYPPVIVCRDAHALNDGEILFRYPGQTSRIKYGDLFAILRERDQTAQKALLNTASELTRIGTDRALILDPDQNELGGTSRRIVIDEALAERLRFIREGEFEERSGAPTLRLVGDVQPVDDDGRIIERVEDHALSSDAALMAYLDNEEVRTPLEFIRLSAMVQRHWLPLFHFVRLSGQGVEAAIAVLEQTEAVYRPSKRGALERLRGCKSAYSPPTGPIVGIVDELLGGNVEFLRDRYTDSQIARALQALPNGLDGAGEFRPLARRIFDASQDNAGLRSQVFRAVARLDELENA